MRRIVFTADKGGVGKTTTVANVAVRLHELGKKVLVVDMDPQADVTFALLGERAPEAGHGYMPPTVHALLTGQYTFDQVLIRILRTEGLNFFGIQVISGHTESIALHIECQHVAHHAQPDKSEVSFIHLILLKVG